MQIYKVDFTIFCKKYKKSGWRVAFYAGGFMSKRCIKIRCGGGRSGLCRLGRHKRGKCHARCPT